ncbi:hypothetical protein ACKKBG_A04920 [Auxenochlorella protothecoides x Auxenochlorella symbiontica]
MARSVTRDTTGDDRDQRAVMRTSEHYDPSRSRNYARRRRRLAELNSRGMGDPTESGGDSGDVAAVTDLAVPPQAALELLATNREILASMQSMATTLERLSKFMHNRLDDIPKLTKMVAKNEQAISNDGRRVGRGTAKTIRPDCWGQER